MKNEFSTTEPGSRGLCQWEPTSASLPVKGWDAFYSSTPLHVFPATAELFQQGSPSLSVYFLEHGLIKLVRMEENGRQVIVSFRFPGSLVGAASAIIDEPHSMIAIALTRCSILCIPTKSFLYFVQTDAKLSWQLHQVHSREAFDRPFQVAQFVCLSARQRLERLLRQFAAALEIRPDHGEMRLRLPLKDMEIAEVLGITPEHLCRVLKQMRQEGIIHREKGWFLISHLQAA